MDLSDFSAAHLLDEIRKRNVSLPTVAIIGFVDVKFQKCINGKNQIVWIKKPFNPEDIIESVKGIERALNKE